MCLILSKKGGKKNKTDFDIRVPQEGVEPSRPKTLVLSQVTMPFVYQGMVASIRLPRNLYWPIVMCFLG